MTHASPWWGCHPCDKSRDRFLAILLDPLGGFFFCRAADFADQDHRTRAGIFIEQFHAIEVRQPADGISTNPDASRLAVTARSELPDSFVRERAGAGDHADVAGLVNLPRHDADVGCSRIDAPRAIR